MVSIVTTLARLWSVRSTRHLLAACSSAALIAIFPVYDASAETTHVVARGQTLVWIAKRYRTTAESLRMANNLRKGQLIHPGLVLVIPEKGKESEAAKKAQALNAGKREGKDSKGGRRKEASAKGSGKKSGAKNAQQEREERRVKRPGFVRLVRGSERFEGQILSRRGKLVPSSLRGLSRFLRHVPSNTQTAIDPRLATLLGMVSDHFEGRRIHVVSGYRPYSPAQYTPHSNHNVGKAIDFFVEGIANTALRDYCRTLRNAGVGFYPNSSFVHLDVRTTKTFWVDYSRPGEAPRYDSSAARVSADEAPGDVESPVGQRPSEEGSAPAEHTE